MTWRRKVHTEYSGLSTKRVEQEQLLVYTMSRIPQPNVALCKICLYGGILGQTSTDCGF